MSLNSFTCEVPSLFGRYLTTSAWENSLLSASAELEAQKLPGVKGKPSVQGSYVGNA